MVVLFFFVKKKTADEVRISDWSSDVCSSDLIDIEGACEGSMACATCHVVVEPEWYGKLVPASEDEADMLDLVFGLRQTSRLGCQVVVTEELDGLTVRLPDATRNLLLEG